MTICNQDENMVFFMENGAVDTYALTATSAAVNHPVTELQNTSRRLTWRSTSLAANTITGNWTTPITPEANLRGRKVGIVFINHNFPKNIAGDYTNINVKLYDSTLTLRINENFTGVNFSGMGYKEETAIGLIRPYKNRVIYIAGATEFDLRRCEITLTGVGALAGVTNWEIGRLYVGPIFQPADNVYWENDKLGAVDDTRVSFSRGGDQFSDYGSKRRGVYLEPPASLVTQSDISYWMYLIHVIGSRTPIFVDVHPRIAGDFGPSEISEAYLNLLWQVYGIANNNIRFGRRASNVMSVTGSMQIVEQA